VGNKAAVASLSVESFYPAPKVCSFSWESAQGTRPSHATQFKK